MGRPSSFTADALLDAARRVVLRHGVRGTTVAAIAAEAGAPVGSIYHRFNSVDDVLAQVWLRAAAATQQLPETLVADEKLDPRSRAQQIAIAFYDHCLANAEDTRVLDQITQQDLARLKLQPAQRAKVNESNRAAARQVAGMAQALFGTADREACDLVVLALVDLPASFARRHLLDGMSPPPQRRKQLPAAVAAILST